MIRVLDDVPQEDPGDIRPVTDSRSKLNPVQKSTNGSMRATRDINKTNGKE